MKAEGRRRSLYILGSAHIRAAAHAISLLRRVRFGTIIRYECHLSAGAPPFPTRPRRAGFRGNWSHNSHYDASSGNEAMVAESGGVPTSASKLEP